MKAIWGLAAIRKKTTSKIAVHRNRKWQRSPAYALSIAVSLAVAGCQTAGGLSSQLGLAQISASDSCGVHSQALRESQGFFERSIVQGALIGAVGGAVLGGVVGGSSRAALAGGLIGGLAGAGGGYLAAREKEAQSRAQLTDTVYRDVQAESAEVVRALAGFERARTCRLQRADSIKRDLAQGRLTREEAARQLSLERSRFADDLKVVRAIGAKIDERHAELLTATETLSGDDVRARALLGQTRTAEAAAWRNPDLSSGLAASGLVRATTTVNVRQQPSAQASRVGSLAQGHTATLLEPDKGGWSRIRLSDGKTGYVASSYISSTATGVGQSVPSTSGGPTLASLTRSIPSSASTETKTVGALFEGREKRIELERLSRQAEREERTVFELDI